MKLQDLLYGVTIQELVGKTDRSIHALNFDSRKIEKDDVFFAISGYCSRCTFVYRSNH